MLIEGINGSGKTSLIRSIALSLLFALISNSYARKNWLQFGQDSFFIKVHACKHDDHTDHMNSSWFYGKKNVG